MAIKTSTEFCHIVNQELQRYSYKPGWRDFRVVEIYNPENIDDHETICLIFKPNVPDVLTGKPQTNSVQCVFKWRPYTEKENPTYSILHDKLEWFELHELDEFLWCDGKPIVYPHED